MEKLHIKKIKLNKESTTINLQEIIDNEIKELMKLNEGLKASEIKDMRTITDNHIIFCFRIFKLKNVKIKVY